MATLALTCILKNERHNLPLLLESVKGIFDEIHFTDTGSTDGSQDYIESEAAKVAGCPVYLHHFAWCEDFSAARNHALPFIKTDFWMWMDLDDSLENPELFKRFKEHVMCIADYWFMPYNYAYDENGNVACVFQRERILNTKKQFKFNFPIHEGVIAKSDHGPVITSMITSIAIKHRRTLEEIKGDQGRNLRILEAKADFSNPRMHFYHGKELFDLGRIEESIVPLRKCLDAEGMEPHDKITGIQYLCHALVQTKQLKEAISVGLRGIELSPHRAELRCMIGDSYLLQGDLMSARVWYKSAMDCVNQGDGRSPFFTFNHCYRDYPQMQVAKIDFNRGQFDEAEKILVGRNDDEANQVRQDIQKARELFAPDKKMITYTRDIIITCPAQGAYEWDSEIYKVKGIGGSETAAVEVATWLKKLTNRPVKIFAPRSTEFQDSNGVWYIPIEQLRTYLKHNIPYLHIAWRHSEKLTSAKTLVWAHDLMVPGLENIGNYDKVLALSDFHKNLLMVAQNVPEDKIYVFRNGIVPERFTKKPEKVYGRVIWPNSPDRGLEHAIAIMDRVRKVIPEAHLKCFYGLENLTLYGLKDKAEQLKAMVAERPWIDYVGNVPQDRLVEEFYQSQVWLYPATFIETFCISALESLATNCWPVVRKIGALKNTLGGAEAAGQCDLIDVVSMDEEAYDIFAERVIAAIKENKWEKVALDLDAHSWHNVTKELMGEFLT